MSLAECKSELSETGSKQFFEEPAIQLAVLFTLYGRATCSLEI